MQGGGENKSGGVDSMNVMKRPRWQEMARDGQESQDKTRDDKR